MPLHGKKTLSIPAFLGAAGLIASIGFGFFFNGTAGIFLVLSYSTLLFSFAVCLALHRESATLTIRMDSYGLFTGLLVAFWVYAFASIFFSTYFYNSWISFVILSSLWLSTFIALQIKTHYPECLKFIIGGIVFLLIFQSGIGIWQYAVSSRITGYPQAFGTFYDPNTYGGWLNLTLLPVLALSFGAQHKVLRNAGYFLALMAFAAMIMSAGRGQIFTFFVCFGILSWLVRERIQAHKIEYLSLVLLGSIIFVSIWGVTWGFGDNSRPLAGVVKTQSGTERLEIWRITLDIIMDFPLTGIGLGNYRTHFLPYTDGTFSSMGQYAHNDPLQFGAEMGIAAFILFYSVGAAFLLLFIKAMKHAQQAYGLIGIFCGLLSMVMHAHVNFHFYILPMLITAGSLLGLFLTEARKKLPAPKTFTILKIRKAILILATLPVILLFWHASSIYYVEERIQKELDQNLRNQDLPAAMANINTITTYALGFNQNAYLYSARLLLKLIELPFLDQSIKHQLIGELHRLIRRADMLNLFAADLYVLKGHAVKYSDLPEQERAQKALENYLKAVELDPKHVEARLAAARTAVNLNRNNKAYDILKAGIEVNYIFNSPKDLFFATYAMARDRNDEEIMQKIKNRRKVWNNQVQKLEAVNATSFWR